MAQLKDPANMHVCVRHSIFTDTVDPERRLVRPSMLSKLEVRTVECRDEKVPVSCVKDRPKHSEVEAIRYGSDQDDIRCSLPPTLGDSSIWGAGSLHTHL